MKKIIFIVCLGLLLGGCGSKPAQVNKLQAEKFSGSIEDLMAKHKSIKCELIAKDNEAMISGTTYISDGKARSDYQNKIEGKIVNGHMINDGTWLYTWMDEYPGQAMKVEFETMQSGAFNAAQTQDTGYEKYKANLDYNCYQWTKDDSLLTPPANVNFQDFTSLIQSAQGLMGNINSANNTPNTDKGSMCGACDNIPDATAKSMCKSRLGCK